MKIDDLLRVVYDKNFLKLNELIIVIKHHGSKDDKKIIDGSNIIKVTKDNFVLKDNTVIPSHRIIKIKKKENLPSKED